MRTQIGNISAVPFLGIRLLSTPHGRHHTVVELHILPWQGLLTDIDLGFCSLCGRVYEGYTLYSIH